MLQRGGRRYSIADNLLLINTANNSNAQRHTMQKCPLAELKVCPVYSWECSKTK